MFQHPAAAQRLGQPARRGEEQEGRALGLRGPEQVRGAALPEPGEEARDLGQD